MLGVFNINIAGLGLPLQCLGLGTFMDNLVFTMFFPVVIAAAIVLVSLAIPYLKGIVALDYRWFRRGAPKTMLLAALPWLLMLAFLVFPMVSSSAFRAFSCEDFDDGRSFLRADYAIECYTEDYTRVEHLAWLGILLYPVGISATFASLLFASRRAIREKLPTALSKALGFLVDDYEPAFLWWELLMLWRQLLLVGFAILISPGTIEQLVISFLVTLSYMLLFAVAAPFKNEGDDYFAQACSFALTAVFFFLLVLKVDVLTNEMDPLLSEQQRDKYHFNIYLVTGGMIGSILLALLLAAAMAAQQIVQAARVPTIRLQRTGAPPDLLLSEGDRFHMFLSHIWGTGQVPLVWSKGQLSYLLTHLRARCRGARSQDQCATIKRQLIIMLLGVSVFLDVDDLRSIDALEEHIGESAVIMLFVSKGYFLSKSELPTSNPTPHAHQHFQHPVSECYGCKYAARYHTLRV